MLENILNRFHILQSHGLFMLLIAKHRNGELGEIPLTFIHEQTKVINYNPNNSGGLNQNVTFVQDNNSNNEFTSFKSLNQEQKTSDINEFSRDLNESETPF